MTPEEVLLTGFSTAYLEEVRARRPDLPVSHLFGDPPPNAVELAQSVGAKSLAINQKHITPEW